MSALTVLASDGSQDTQTITKRQWEEARALADEVHVVVTAPCVRSVGE